MKVPSIDLPVVGRPVSHFMGTKAALEKAVTGAHDVGGGRTVIVRKALVVAQPQGALVYYAATHQKMAMIEHGQSLIIDPGSRTFDWLVAWGMRLFLKTSDWVTRVVSHVLRVIAIGIALRGLRDLGRHVDVMTPRCRDDRFSPVLFESCRGDCGQTLRSLGEGGSLSHKPWKKK